MSDQDPAYVGRKACGCVIAAYVDRPEYRAEHAKDIAALIRKGYVVEHTTVAEARALPWATGGRGACEHDNERIDQLKLETA